MYYYRMMDANDWASTILMMLLGLLFVGAVVIVATRLLRTTNQSSNINPTQSVRALDIAKERYAKGEINHDEFERIKKDISA